MALICLQSFFLSDGVKPTYENHMQRVRESKPISTLRKSARFRWKLASISALTTSSRKAAFARFAQSYADPVSEFARKTIDRRRFSMFEV
jgi:hypothetical protein